MREIVVGSHREMVVEPSDYPPERFRALLAHDTIAVVGYGILGRNQALNLRDRGLKVLVGVRETGLSWKRAVDDGWLPGVSLFSIGEAARQGTLIQFLLSDAGQREQWPRIREQLTPGKTLLFAHGFSVVFRDQTGVVPPEDVDVILVSPRGSGTTLRRLFLEGRGLNASFAIHQDRTGTARDRCLACASAMGYWHLYETTFEREVHGDLTGERGSLLGAIFGLWLAQYEVLREHGHSPTEAFNETVEEATQSLYPLIAEKGMDWMYTNCSATAQRGALDWYRRFYEACKPVLGELYARVESGDETRRVLESNSRPNYQQEIAEELKAIQDSEMWQAGKEVRHLRP